MITKENWTHCVYQSQHMPVLAQLTIGAEYKGDSSLMCYYVSQLDQETHCEKHQHTFDNFDHALEVINKRYGDWILVDREKLTTSKSGCDNCQAH